MNQEIELSHEDSLRLNVLFSQNINAIRINESSMVLHALLEEREISIPLNPNCAESKYLKQVREFLSFQVLGSPAGYPVFLKRWTRMGQTRDTNLSELLKLGESEAVVSVTHAPGLTMELAQYAWWCHQSVENARQMLQQPKVANSKFAKELSDFLIEFLPFEEVGKNIIDTVCLLLKNDLVDEKTKLSLWKKGKRKSTYYLGFVSSIPDKLPEADLSQPHNELMQYEIKLASLKNNVYAQQIIRLCSQRGQHFIQTNERILSNFSDQDSIIALINSLQEYLNPISYEAAESNKDIEQFKQSVTDPSLLKMLNAITELSKLEESVLNDILSRTNAVGSVLRRKMEPITQPILEHFQTFKS